MFGLSDSYLHTAEEPEVDAFPNPSPGVDGDVQLGGDDHRVVLHQADLQSVSPQSELVPSS